MSGGPACTCTVALARPSRWRVIDYRCNYSAFNGYHRTPSNYSSIVCLDCGRLWRTKASYVDGLKHLSEEERQAWLGMPVTPLPAK